MCGPTLLAPGYAGTLSAGRRLLTQLVLSMKMFGCKSCMERREAFLVAAHSTSAPRCAARRGKRAPRDAGVANPSGDGGRARSHPGAGLAPRRMQGARQRRQTPVRAYANHQVRRQLGRRRRRAALLIRWSGAHVRFWSRRRAAVRSRVPLRRRSGRARRLLPRESACPAAASTAPPRSCAWSPLRKLPTAVPGNETRSQRAARARDCV